MNERIQQLKQQAGIDFNPDQEGLNLFAQLIVAECARVGGDIVLNQNEDNDMGVFLGIKKHFGVAE